MTTSLVVNGGFDKGIMTAKKIVLFDVDGTLTIPRQKIDPEFRQYLFDTLANKFDIGIVGGSDWMKISEQLGGEDVLRRFNYVFSENGLVGMKNGETLLAKQSIVQYLGEEKLQDFINVCLEYMSKLKIPNKRGTFIEYRTGLINVSPIGRNCSQEERIAFAKFDEEHQIRARFVSHLRETFPDLPLQYGIGGQISFDVYPNGWDKSYCLSFLEEYETIYFLGDKCEPGGNDYPIFSHPRVKGIQVQGPHVTKKCIDNIVKCVQ